jgi:hypothetical protein
MKSVKVTMPVDARTAWDVVSDPETYPTWLVGAVEMRAVDDGWPAPGTSFHHRVGLGGPITINDSSTSLAVDPPRLLVLEARARPLGRAYVEMEVRPLGDRCEVVIREGMLRPLRPLTPVAQPLIMMRNRKSLQRLHEFLKDRAGANRLA